MLQGKPLETPGSKRGFVPIGCPQKVVAPTIGLPVGVSGWRNRGRLRIHFRDINDDWRHLFRRDLCSTKGVPPQER